MKFSHFPLWSRHLVLCAAVLGLAQTAIAAGKKKAVVKPKEEAMIVYDASLAKSYKDYFPIGVAMPPGMTSAPKFKNLLTTQFNMMVAENQMKPMALARNGEGQYDFDAADEMVNFALANGMTMRGHALLWHDSTPPWMLEGVDGKDATREVLIARMKKYIQDVVTHFKGRIKYWDVVNEAIVANEPGKPSDEKGYRKSPWYRILGRDYIELAFRFAHEADPDAILIYNDYSTENPTKRNYIFDMVKGLLAKGVPIHGIGHQTHCSIYPGSEVDNLETSIEMFAGLGLTNQITEFDLSLNKDISKGSTESTPELLKLQAERYEEYFRMFKNNKSKISAVVFWGPSDANSWLRYWPFEREDAPLLFDDNLKPKPAYTKVIEVAAEK